MEEGAVAALHERSSCFGDGASIDFGIHGEADVQASLEVSGLLDRVDRCGDDLDVGIDEWTGVNCEVNQLLTAVRSPMSPIELHDRPMAGDRSRDIDVIAVAVFAEYGRHDVASGEGSDHENPWSDRLMSARLSAAVHGTAAPRADSSQPERRRIMRSSRDIPKGSTAVADDYRCFIYELGLEEPGWMQGFEFVPDQTEVVHHAIGYLVSGSAMDQALRRSAEDASGGWQCYGSSGLQTRDELFLGWAPGQLPTRFPEGSGIAVDPGDFVVMQIHYHYDTSAPADESTLRVDFADDPAADLDRIEFSQFLGPAEIPCSADETGPLCDRNAALALAYERYGAEGVLANAINGICGVSPSAFADMTAGIASSSCTLPVRDVGEIVSVFGHEHEIGKSFRLTLNAGQPDEQILLDIPDWSFDWQYNYYPVDSIVLDRGDTITIDCSWDRARRAPDLEPSYVLWADGTNDEMCFSTIAIRELGGAEAAANAEDVDVEDEADDAELGFDLVELDFPQELIECMDAAGFDIDTLPARDQIPPFVTGLFSCQDAEATGAMLAAIVEGNFLGLVDDDGLTCLSGRLGTEAGATDLLMFVQPDSTRDERGPVGEIVGDCVSLSAALAEFGFPLPASASDCIDDAGRAVIVEATIEGGLPEQQVLFDVVNPCALETAAAEAGVSVQIAALDVTNAEQIEGLVAEVVAEHGAIDLLVNNAGASYVGTLEQISDENLAWMMDVNFVGVARLTRAALPHMRANGGGRVITVTSVGGVVGQPFNDAYCAAKFAVEGLMQSLHPVAAQHGVRVSVVEPGAIASEFITNAGESVQERMTTVDAYTPQVQAYVKHISEAFSVAQTPQDIADVILAVAQAEDPAFRYQTGERSTAFAGMSLSDVDGSTVTQATGSWTVSPIDTPRASAIAGSDLLAGKDSTQARLGTLAEFDLDASHVRRCSRFDQRIEREGSVGVAATEVPGSELEHELPTVAVGVGNASFAGVVHCARDFAATVDGLDRSSAQRAVAHSRHIGDGLGAELLGSTPPFAHDLCAGERCVLADRGGIWECALLDQNVTVAVDLSVGTEAKVGAFAVRRVVDPSALVTAEGPFFVVGGHDVLPELRTATGQDLAAVAHHGKCAQDRVFGLHQVIDSDKHDQDTESNEND
ncbi:Estradiol 17-beta-dehydrogenase 1 [Nymphon striatum]|nr:Estradiol 17-beta-dehydrogenase 1 [Nymphon striatum]